MRRGVSLIEVLIAMLVMLFGLVALLSLFLIGADNVSRAELLSASTQTGRNALAEIANRRIMRDANFDQPINGMSVSPFDQDLDTGIVGRFPVAVDPIGKYDLGVAATNLTGPRLGMMPGVSDGLQRVWIKAFPSPNEPPMPSILARAIFGGSDRAVDQTTRQIIRNQTLTWMLIATKYSPVLYNVSIVTFHRRVASEDVLLRAIYLDRAVVLRTSANSVMPPIPDWVLDATYHANDVTGPHRAFWYKVAGVGDSEIVGGELRTVLTLEGSTREQTPLAQPLSGDVISAVPARDDVCVLMHGILGVYEKIPR